MTNTTTCTSCSRALRIPDELMGQQVKCPACGNTFTAAVDGAPPPRRPEPPPRERTPPPRDRVSSRDDRRRYEDDDDRDRPRSRRRDYDDDDDYDRRPRRRRRDYEEHRGTLILVLGILAIVGMFTIVTGPM